MNSSILKSLTNIAFRTALAVNQSRQFKRYQRALNNPRETQDSVLMNILRRNSNTEYGKRWYFESIETAEDFALKLPVQEYEGFRELIEKQELTGTPCLTQDKPIYYQRTSGTTNEPKYIPMTFEGMKRIKGYQSLAAYVQSKTAKVFSGKIFGVTGQAVEGKMLGGTPFGAASGLIYRQQSRFIRSRYVLPPSISTIEDYATRYLIMAILGAAEPNVTGVSTANPSTLLKILEVLNKNAQIVLDSLENNTLHHSIPVEENIVKSVNDALPNSKKRWQELSRIYQDKGSFTYEDIWPNLAGIVTWTGGSCQIPLFSLKKIIPKHTKIIELGYVASEFRGTVNIDHKENLCLPTFLDNYFEFVERQNWEADKPHFLRLDEIEEDKEYYIFVTTPDGLYRYNINDIVQVTGWMRKTPAIEFVRKGKGVTNITGEKLHEDQVIRSVLGMCEHLKINCPFFVMMADVNKSEYQLFLELDSHADIDEFTITKEIDLRLRNLNIEYDEKCKSGRLSPVSANILGIGTADAYREKLVAEGQRDAQFKVQCLQYTHECKFNFFDYLKTTKS